MPTFEYSAIAADGKPATGLVFGSSLEQVTADLRGKGLDVQRIGVATSTNDPLSAPRVEAPKPTETPAVEQTGNPEYVHAQPMPGGELAPPWQPRSYVATSIWGPLAGRVPLPRLLFFFQQFATMADAGVPIVQSLNTLSNQARNEKLSKIIREMRVNVEAGRPPSAAMQRYPEVFSPVMISLVRAGEAGGFTVEAYETVARYIEREIELRNLYRRVTFYPKLEIFFSIVIIVGANMIISSVGGSEKLYSPLTNPKILAWVVSICVGLFLFFRVGLANPRIKYNWDLFTVSIPGFGKILRELAMAKFGRAFGALYKGGVPVHRALPMAADACGNEYLRARMVPAYRELERGEGIHKTLVSTGAFSPIVLDMVHTGETTGNMDQMLNKMADFYEAEAATKSTMVGFAFGVVILLLVAIYIGFIVINFYTGHYAGVQNAAGG